MKKTKQNKNKTNTSKQTQANKQRKRVGKNRSNHIEPKKTTDKHIDFKKNDLSKFF